MVKFSIYLNRRVFVTIKKIRRLISDNSGIINHVYFPFNNIHCGYSLEYFRGDSNEYQQNTFFMENGRKVIIHPKQRIENSVS